LAMHTDAGQFIDLCDQAPPRFSPEDPGSRTQIAAAAPAIHETFRELGRREGWLKAHLDKPFEALDEFYQESNRQAAVRMLAILNLAGLRLEPGEASAASEEEVTQHLEFRLEALAEAEHEGWMDWHIKQGWRYGTPKDEEE